jgi:hypothetical protein
VKACYIPNLVILCESGETSAPSVSICAKGTCYPSAGDPVELAGVLLQVSLHQSVMTSDHSGDPLDKQ